MQKEVFQNKNVDLNAVASEAYKIATFKFNLK